MAKAGSGDVLTGMMAGILAQHGNDGLVESRMSRGLSARPRRGYRRGESGEISLMATDIIRAIPKAYAKLIAELDHAEP